jgi:hypothetical protein
MSFAKWMTLASLAYATCEFLLLALVGIAARATIRSLWLPYLLLLGCWAVFAPLVYWVNCSHNSTKTYARLFASIASVYISCVGLAIAYSVVTLGMVSRGIVLSYFVPSIIPGAIIVWVTVYVIGLSRAETSKVH